MKEHLAFVTIMLWPIIPLMWIPMHIFTAFFRRLGKWSYFFVVLAWLVCAALIFSLRDMLLSTIVNLPRGLATIGMVLLLGGTLLQIWTAKLLSFTGITGGHELDNRQDVFQSQGAYSSVRHPAYLAHTFMLLGIFFITRSAAVGGVAVVDFIIVHFVIIPLEERELIARFGPAYEEYRRKVPRFFPHIRL
ncbi:MAG TPA: isoprenylcysteine carboxylmethyltransferase family protein [Dissulfurispiraceae bacterium]|nr:isoprenylcysteine carboxylmethyltransferase family protein [Dissulfurispiraceae bacterium]